MPIKSPDLHETQDPFQLLRFVLAILAGIIVAYGLGQAIEFGLVVFVNGSVPRDSMQYFAVRNHPQVLVAKLFYSAVIGLGAGYLAAWIGGRMGILAGIALALAQMVGIGWAMVSRNPIFSYTPMWMWLMLLLVAPPAMVGGAWIRGRRYIGQD